MNIQLRAALHTIGMLAVIGLSVFLIFAVSAVVSVNPETVFAILLVIFGIYTIYQLMLSKIQCDDEIAAIDKRINERIEQSKK